MKWEQLTDRQRRALVALNVIVFDVLGEDDRDLQPMYSALVEALERGLPGDLGQDAYAARDVMSTEGGKRTECLKGPVWDLCEGRGRASHEDTDALWRQRVVSELLAHNQARVSEDGQDFHEGQMEGLLDLLEETGEDVPALRRRLVRERTELLKQWYPGRFK